MDGINPTLAFAALFLGLSGHPRDVAHHPVETDQSAAWDYAASADLQMGSLRDCPAMAFAIDGQGLPMTRDKGGLFQDRRVALAGSVVTVGPEGTDAPPAPGWLSGEIFHDDDPCGDQSPRP